MKDQALNIAQQLGDIFADAAASAKTRRLAVAEVAGMIAGDKELAAALAAALCRAGKSGAAIIRSLSAAADKLALSQTVFLRTVWTVSAAGQAASVTKQQAQERAAERQAASPAARQAAELAAARARIAELEALASSAGAAATATATA